MQWKVEGLFQINVPSRDDVAALGVGVKPRLQRRGYAEGLEE